MKVMIRISRQLVAVAVIASLVRVASPEAREPSVKGDSLVFALHDLEGNVVASSDERFKGKVVFVTIWGTWCSPCISEVPTFIDLHDRYVEDGLVILAIAFEREKAVDVRREGLRRFSREHEINYLVLDGGATSDFSTALPMIEHVKGLPIEIIIDRAGVVVESRNGYGYKKKWARKLEKELKKLLAVH